MKPDLFLILYFIIQTFPHFYSVDGGISKYRLLYKRLQLQFIIKQRLCLKTFSGYSLCLPPTRLEELARPLCTILHRPNLLPVAVSQTP